MTRRLSGIDPRKPETLGLDSRSQGDRPGGSDAERFASVTQRAIMERLAALGLSLRIGLMEDLNAIEAAFVEYLAPVSARALSSYDLYRIVRFGRPLLLENRAGCLVGFCLEQSYHDPARTSYIVTLGVAPALAGHRLASSLLLYAGSQAMAAGCRFQRAIVSPTNFASLATFLNHVGHVAEGFYLELHGYGEPRLAMVCPLTPEGLTANRIDHTKLSEFVSSRRAGHDYRLVPCLEAEELARMYRETTFRISAFVRAGLLSPAAQFLALPEQCLRSARLITVSESESQA